MGDAINRFIDETPAHVLRCMVLGFVGLIWFGAISLIMWVV